MKKTFRTRARDAATMAEVAWQIVGENFDIACADGTAVRCACRTGRPRGPRMARRTGDAPAAAEHRDPPVWPRGSLAGGRRSLQNWATAGRKLVSRLAPVRRVCRRNGRPHGCRRICRGSRSARDHIDELHVRDELTRVAAVGVDSEGNEHPLAVVEGATESTATVQALLDNLTGRGLDPVVCRLFIINGAGGAVEGDPTHLRPPHARRSNGIRSARPATSSSACQAICDRKALSRTMRRRPGN